MWITIAEDPVRFFHINSQCILYRSVDPPGLTPVAAESLSLTLSRMRSLRTLIRYAPVIGRRLLAKLIVIPSQPRCWYKRFPVATSRYRRSFSNTLSSRRTLLPVREDLPAQSPWIDWVELDKRERPDPEVVIQLEKHSHQIHSTTPTSKPSKTTVSLF